MLGSATRKTLIKHPPDRTFMFDNLSIRNSFPTTSILKPLLQKFWSALFRDRMGNITPGMSSSDLGYFCSIYTTSHPFNQTNRTPYVFSGMEHMGYST